MRKPTVSLLVLCALSSCTVGPDYERPAVAGGDGEWTIPAVNDAAPLAEAWRELQDPVLDALVEKAVAANLDIAMAEARLRQARAGLDAVMGGQLPEAAVTASANRQRLSENGQLPVGALPGFERELSLYDAGFDASWEIDLWGGTRRAVEAAGYRLQAADAARHEVRLRVVAEVVRAYTELREAQSEAIILKSDAAAHGTIASLSQVSYEAGEIARSDAAGQAAATRAAEAQVPLAEARARAAAGVLALLTAQTPEDMADLLEHAAPLPIPPDAVQAGLRADVLRRRPDVLAAEARLAAATADVGFETARLFPKISLMGSVGQQARDTSDLSSGTSTRFTIGPSLYWPIFAGGRIRAQVRAADARADEAGAAYEKAVLGALSDSETALNRYNAALTASQALFDAREQAAVRFDLARQRRELGEDSQIDFERARLAFDEADRAALKARAEALRAHSSLVKALGGSWEAGPLSARAKPSCAPGQGEGSCG